MMKEIVEKIGIKDGGILAKEVSPKISIYNTLITTFGLTYNEYSGVFFHVITLDDLFSE
jgi:hypothetical protein